MATWSIIRNNSELALTDRNPFDLVSINGVGTAPIRRLTNRSPFQDGDSDLGFRLDARMINLVLFFSGSSLSAADSYRDALYEYIKPTSNPVYLRCVRDDGSVRQLDCHPVGTIDAPVTDQDRIWAAQKLAVQLRAAEPVWYNPQQHYWAAIGGSRTGASGFVVPAEIPMTQTVNTSIDASIALQYNGSWSEYPVITLYGPATGFSLENVTTGQILQFANMALTAGQYVTVDLRYGYKTVTNQSGTNKIGELSDDSDLASWRLAPAPEASGGANLLNFVVNATATDATGVQIAYYDRYIGL